MSHTSRILTVGAIAMVSVTSCSLPPRQAWTQIQREGLIPFVAEQWNDGSVPAKGSATSSQPMIATKQAPASKPVAAAPTTPAPVVAGNTTPSPAMLDAQKIPTAGSVPGLSGYVRSPYTNPPRLVDVRGMSVGSKVVCPFTNKPFLVPAASQSAPQQVATAPAPTPAPIPQSAPIPMAPATVPAPSTVAALTKPQPSAPPVVAPQTKPQTQPTPAADQPKAVAQEIPFGNSIAGRPGFVNSPFAAKHQLVDVTGLPTGMEVKCPYTGKLFRVPPQDQAQGKAPTTSVASPEKK